MYLLRLLQQTFQYVKNSFNILKDTIESVEKHFNILKDTPKTLYI